MFRINEPAGILLNSKEKHNKNTKGVRENVADHSYQLNTSELKSVWVFLCRVWGFFLNFLVFCLLVDGRPEVETTFSVM